MEELGGLQGVGEDRWENCVMGVEVEKAERLFVGGLGKEAGNPEMTLLKSQKERSSFSILASSLVGLTGIAGAARQ